MRRTHTIMVETEDRPEISALADGGIRIDAGEDSVELDDKEAMQVYWLVRAQLETRGARDYLDSPPPIQ